MKSKIHSWLINLGTIIATLLLFSPIVILIYWHIYHNSNWWIWLIFSILYDIYYYDNMQKREYISKQVKNIKDIKKGKSIYKTEENKLISYKIICENIANEFKDY